MKAVSTSARRLIIAELAFLSMLILTIMFIPYRKAYMIPCGIGVVLICIGVRFVARRFFGAVNLLPELGEMGFSFKNFWPSIWLVVITLVVSASLITIGWWFETLQVQEFQRAPLTLTRVVSWFRYPIWSLVQEMMLQVYVLRRLLLILPDQRLKAITIAVGCFSIFHMPNPALVLATIFSGAACCLYYEKYRCIWTPWVSHAILGITFKYAFSSSFTGGMLVGINYVRYLKKLLA